VSPNSCQRQRKKFRENTKYGIGEILSKKKVHPQEGVCASEERLPPHWICLVKFILICDNIKGTDTHVSLLPKSEKREVRCYFLCLLRMMAQDLGCLL
jgi:hypothetical protein